MHTARKPPTNTKKLTFCFSMDDSSALSMNGRIAICVNACSVFSMNGRIAVCVNTCIKYE